METLMTALTVTNATIPVPARRRVTARLRSEAHNLETPWEDVIALAAFLREERDQRSWELGDLMLAVCDNQVGRPKAGAAERTISALAAAIGEDRAVLSALRANAEFYTKAMRADLPPQISWRQTSEARRRSGWRPDLPVTAEHRARAMKFVLRMEEDQDDPPPPPSPAERLGRAVEVLAGLRLDSEPAQALLTDAIATAQRAVIEEAGEGEPETLNDLGPLDQVLPVWSLADDTPWQWLARHADPAQRAEAGIIILEGAAWRAYQQARVRGIQ